MILTSMPVHSYKMAAIKASDVDALIPATFEKNRVSSFLNKLRYLIKNIPDSIPEGGDNDKLAAFCGDPKDLDDRSLDPDSLWEEVLNLLLKSSLGWGTEGNMEEIICKGRKGIEGLATFVEYFIEERGVSDSLFEGKLSYMLNYLKKM